jgi:threonine/homoserine/homoserine lactone efflux protein
MLIAALVGFLVGWIGSVPVAGPISALVVTRGIAGRFRSGVFIAIGSAVVEALYAFLAFWGFSNFLTRYPVVVPVSRLFAAVILFALGIALLRKPPHRTSDEPPPQDSALGSLVMGASICALNPTLIATWTAVVTTLYSSELVAVTSAQALPFAAGVMSGIAGWFVVLLWIIHRYKERFSAAALDRVVRAIGGFLILVAAWFAWRFAAYFFEANG